MKLENPEDFFKQADIKTTDRCFFIRLRPQGEDGEVEIFTLVKDMDEKGVILIMLEVLSRTISRMLTVGDSEIIN